MKTLQTIQKTVHVFQILAKIAFVFCIVGAAFCALGALCAAAWYTGGEVFSLFGESIHIFDVSGNEKQVLAELLSDLVYLLTDIVLLGLVGRYFKTEQAEGTPFTENGANLLKKLGIHCIWMPIVAIVIASVITVCLQAEGSEFSNLPSIVTGILLILASLVFRYGAELEKRVP